MKAASRELVNDMPLSAAVYHMNDELAIESQVPSQNNA
jgi:hypothetical protein